MYPGERCRSIRLALSESGIRGAHISEGTQPTVEQRVYRGVKGCTGFARYSFRPTPSELISEMHSEGEIGPAASRTKRCMPAKRSKQSVATAEYNGRGQDISSSGIDPSPPKTARVERVRLAIDRVSSTVTSTELKFFLFLEKAQS